MLVGSAGVLVWTNKQSQLQVGVLTDSVETITREKAQLIAAKARADSALAALQSEMANERDPRRRASIQARMDTVQATRRNINTAQGVDYNAIMGRNAAAIAVITVEIEGDTTGYYTGTAFAVAPGMLLTNRHVVAGRRGTQRAVRIAVQFSGSREVLRAVVERLSPDADIALIRITDAGSWPTVTVDQSTVPAAGAPIALLGFPGYEGGEGRTPVATLITGNLTELVTDSVLRLDTYSGVGASGSPVLDQHGRVIGIEYGGIPGTRTVFGLPIRRAMALLNR